MVHIVCRYSVPLGFLEFRNFYKIVTQLFSCEKIPATGYCVDDVEGAMKALDQLFTFKAFV